MYLRKIRLEDMKVIANSETCLVEFCKPGFMLELCQLDCLQEVPTL